jgi:5,5'-dehydrodivanillate O-demethylase oxygenase subunit
MLSRERNERLTQVSRGTPGGELLRRYWQPVAASAELSRKPTKRVRILGEDLALFRNRKGTMGLLPLHCPHRGASLAYGMVEDAGLRCAYHGWLFDASGQCLEQPNEADSTTFRDRVRLTSYPVQELGGLVWAYLGPDPAPLLPRFDLFVQPGVYRTIGSAVLPCNWLQIMENSVDPIHAEWLHGRFSEYLMTLESEQERRRTVNAKLDALGVPERKFSAFRKHIEIGFDVFEFGIMKRRVMEGGSKEDEAWAVGHPLIFPTMLKVGGAGIAEFQLRVPIDDTHTWHIWYNAIQPPHTDAPEQHEIPMYTVPMTDETDEFMLDYVTGQDIMAWVTQGPVADRTTEHLGASDKGVTLLRRVLQEQIAKVERGEDPLGTVRDPEANVCIDLALERNKYKVERNWHSELRGKTQRFNPEFDKILSMFAQDV